jgi:hypothetical protein
VLPLTNAPGRLPIAEDDVSQSGMAESYAYLIIEPAFGFEIVKIFRVCLRAPEVHIGDFEIAPD